MGAQGIEPRSSLLGDAGLQPAAQPIYHTPLKFQYIVLIRPIFGSRIKHLYKILHFNYCWTFIIPKTSTYKFSRLILLYKHFHKFGSLGGIRTHRTQFLRLICMPFHHKAKLLWNRAWDSNSNLRASKAPVLTVIRTRKKLNWWKAYTSLRVCSTRVVELAYYP